MALSAVNPNADHSNVVALNARQHRQPRSSRLAQHAALFCQSRRTQDDVFWLKENAEFLNVLEASAPRTDARAVLSAYGEVYETIDEKLANYPQYYRFILSIALDLEDIGMPGKKAARMCEWVRRVGLVEAELSDLQRAEARRLLARRGQAHPDPALTMRLHRFAGRSATFALPNRKAAYELTHILFYLSEYGRVDPHVPNNVLTSLKYLGLIAYLDQNFDLLAEVCIAMRHAGARPSTIWEGAVQSALDTASVTALDLEQGFHLAPDNYHDYLVSSWLSAMRGKSVMPSILPGGSARIDIQNSNVRALTRMSTALPENVGADWFAAKEGVLAQCTEEEAQVITAAEASTDVFDRFYACFSRQSRP